MSEQPCRGYFLGCGCPRCVDIADELAATAKPRGGRCCACGYEGNEETPCPKREDGHCDHWWDGPESA